jgi:hypothetical protein
VWLFFHCAKVGDLPFTFTHEKYADMHAVYRFYSGNSKAAVAEYWQHFPDHGVPYQNVFFNVHITLRQTCSFP